MIETLLPGVYEGKSTIIDPTTFEPVTKFRSHPIVVCDAWGFYLKNEVVDWLMDHTAGDYKFKSDDRLGKHTIQFEVDEDATVFLLRWS